MVLAEGDKLPMGATFKKIVDGKPSDVPAADIFAGKKVCENFLQNTLLLHFLLLHRHHDTEMMCVLW
jgi:hypothetical protein